MATIDEGTAPNATAKQETDYSNTKARNLSERIKIPQLIEALREIFEEYGTIVDIVAKSSLKRKGQAFIVFDSVQSAENAIDEINGFELFGQSMSLDFARTRSDATVQREGTSEELEQHKRHRKAEKERKQALEAAEAAKNLKRPAPGVPEDDTAAQKAPKTARGAGLKGTSGAGAGVVPDEYLPPNKILFIRQVPEDYGVDALTAIFSRFSGFKEVRTVPGRKGIAFVEYEAEDGAISAKEATAGMSLGENTIRVTFQRQ
ncbi:U1 small nuclear ribonucleoprotein [Aureobasidium subglaciale]|nr:U1 small nuclear ribonucleoprotein [Aureobasidium subglaciale]